MLLALPKGRLFAGVQTSLDHAGFHFEQPNPRTYQLTSPSPHFQAKLFKPRAIPQLVALGICQIGFVGEDLVRESHCEGMKVVLDLKLNKVEIIVATHASTAEILTNPPKRPLVIATEYENLARTWAMKKGLSHIIIQTWGSTEGYAPDQADIIFDCQETGDTIRANGLIQLDHICHSSTCMIVNTKSYQQALTFLQIERLRCALKEHVND